ncbi:unnamed protein product [Protopolystoma xenopodis]|uniref:Uncharacterized protein n=1 Tax=Protopolystoma xenopodis TaxID=117903 RepID=A0A448WII1_9PLAT|nr:unnamed protein product [Protopolystoma xenopodis]
MPILNDTFFSFFNTESPWQQGHLTRFYSLARAVTDRYHLYRTHADWPSLRMLYHHLALFPACRGGCSLLFALSSSQPLLQSRRHGVVFTRTT